MMLRATYDEDGAVASVSTEAFDIEHTWGAEQLRQEAGDHLKVTDTRVTLTAGGYVAVYEIVKATEYEVATRLLSVKAAK